MDDSVIEKAHKTNIEKLVFEFGESLRDKIMEVYSEVREAEEKFARISDFTPIFIYKHAREALKTELEKPEPKPY